MSALEDSEHVDHLIHLRTQHIGPDEILVAAKLEHDSGLTFDQVTDAINVTEANVRKAVPAAQMIDIEPDLHPEHSEEPAPDVGTDSSHS